MLQYMNRGIQDGCRRYFDHPIQNWEFLAVVRGSIQPVCPNKVAAPFETRRLWIMPPQAAHVWRTHPAGKCLVYVFHFATILPLLESSLPVSRVWSIPLSDGDTRVLSSIYHELMPHYQKPRLSSPAHFEAAMIRLCTLFLQHHQDGSHPACFDPGAETTIRAIQWHREHLAAGVGVKDVAAALHISPGHLRRLFLRIRQETPKAVFTRTMVDEACRLLAQRTLNLKEIAFRCGFSGFSEFYRSFKKLTGQSPSAWRRERFLRDSPRLRPAHSDLPAPAPKPSPDQPGDATRSVPVAARSPIPSEQ